MGGLAAITFGSASPIPAETVAEQVRGIFEALERELSTYRSDSAISLAAEKAGASPVSVSEDAWRVLNLARQFGQLSDGAFDVTMAPVSRLWGFGSGPGAVNLPSADEIRERMKLVDYRRMILKDRSVFLPLKGMAVDLGGIAKGYTVDRVRDFCQGAGVKDFLIDLSGNISASGRPQWGEDWQIGIRDPFDRSRIIGKTKLHGRKALSTSGSYERFVEYAGVRYSHIIDSRTGYPATGTASVTVLCEDACTADCLSTIFFLTGLNGAGELLKKVPPVEVLIVPDDYPINIWLTRGFAEGFVPRPDLANAIRILSSPSN